jgi:hypothetical protein
MEMMRRCCKKLPPHTPESLVEQLRGLPDLPRRLVSPKQSEGGSAAKAGIVLLRSSSFDSPRVRYSFVAAQPFLTFYSFGSRCEVRPDTSRFAPYVQFGKSQAPSEKLRVA